MNGDRDRMGRKTLDFHPTRTYLLFKLFAENIFYVLIHFKSRDQGFVVKHFHRPVVKACGMAPSVPYSKAEAAALKEM